MRSALSVEAKVQLAVQVDPRPGRRLSRRAGGPSCRRRWTAPPQRRRSCSREPSRRRSPRPRTSPRRSTSPDRVRPRRTPSRPAAARSRSTCARPVAPGAIGRVVAGRGIPERRAEPAVHRDVRALLQFGAVDQEHQVAVVLDPVQVLDVRVRDQRCRRAPGGRAPGRPRRPPRPAPGAPDRSRPRTRPRRPPGVRYSDLVALLCDLEADAVRQVCGARTNAVRPPPSCSAVATSAPSGRPAPGRAPNSRSTRSAMSTSPPSPNATPGGHHGTRSTAPPGARRTARATPGVSSCMCDIGGITTTSCRSLPDRRRRLRGTPRSAPPRPT